MSKKNIKKPTTEKKVKGYKGLWRDEYGFYCNPANNKRYYEVGKEYVFDEEISLCHSGFHFCEDIIGVSEYYPLLQWSAIAEIEASGKIITIGNKSVTNTIVITKILSFDEIIEKIKAESHHDGVNRSHGVNNSKGLNNSDGVNNSKGLNNSDGVNWSDGVNRSYGVNWSDGVNNSGGVNISNGVNNSDGVNISNGVNNSKGVNNSNGVNNSKGVNSSHGVNRSHGVNISDGVNSSDGVNNSFGIFNCFGLSNHFFAANIPEKYYLFHKEVSKERYDEVMKVFKNLSNNFVPQFNNLKGLYLKFGSDWKLTPVQAANEIQKQEAWSDLPKEALDFLVSLPEFEADIFFEVTGINLLKQLIN
jgi:hypothetical protein